MNKIYFEEKGEPKSPPPSHLLKNSKLKSVFYLVLLYLLGSNTSFGQLIPATYGTGDGTDGSGTPLSSILSGDYTLVGGTFESVGNVTLTITATGNNILNFNSFNLFAGDTLFVNETTYRGPVIIRCTGSTNIAGVMILDGKNAPNVVGSNTASAADPGGAGGLGGPGGGRPGGAGGGTSGGGTASNGVAGGSFGSSAGRGLGGRAPGLPGGSVLTYTRASGGGGGASYGAVGTVGGNGYDNGGSPVRAGGATGSVYGDAAFTTSMTQSPFTGVLLGGSGGGGAGGSGVKALFVVNAGGPGGGGGGGAILISSFGSVSVTGAINCRGGNGGGSTGNAASARVGGGGGGSGGSIVIQHKGSYSGPTVNGSILNVSGGQGGINIDYGYTNTGGNGGAGRVYVKAESDPCTPPTTDASGGSASSITQNSATLSWTNGNGAGGRIVVLRLGNPVNGAPTSGSTYTANSQYGSGDEVLYGNYVVYNGTGNSVNLTGLPANTTIHYAIYEYDAGPCYVLTGHTGSFTTPNGPGELLDYRVTQQTAVISTVANQAILRIRLTASAGTSPALAISQLNFTTAALSGGTTSASDIVNAKVYYTGTSATFATTTQFGTTVSNPSGNFSVNGSQTLTVDAENYFWLVYNITPSGCAGNDINGHTVDAALASVNTGSIVSTPLGDRLGNRTINIAYCTPVPGTGALDFSSNPSHAITAVSCTGSGSTFNWTGADNVHGYINNTAYSGELAKGNTYTLNVTRNGTAESSRVFAWVDWNNDKDFNDPGEQIANGDGGYLISGSSVASGTFTVPQGACTGSYRMRVWVWYQCVSGCTSPVSDPCSILDNAGNIGQVRDFLVNVFVPPVNDNPLWNNPTLGNISYVYPNVYNIQGSTAGATVSMQGGNPLTTKKEVWYQFTAISTGVSIRVSSDVIEPNIYLFSGTYDNLTQINSETIVATNGPTKTAVLNFGGLTTGQTYRIAVGSNTGTNGAFNICLQQLRKASCSVYNNISLCSSIGTTPTGAATTTYTFTGAGSASTNGLMLLSTPALLLAYGNSYPLSLTANYDLHDAAGLLETISVANANACTVAIGAHALVEVKSNQRCPATLYRSGYLLGTPSVCGATGYEIEFTPVSDCNGNDPEELETFTKTITGSSPSIYLSYAFGDLNPVSGYPYVGRWAVRWRPLFVNNTVAGNYPANGQIISVNSTSANQSMVLEPADNSNTATTALTNNVSFGLYPNPNTGDMVNLNITGITSDNVFVRIMDGMGRVIYTNRYAVEGSLNTIVTFSKPLASGLYMVEFTEGGNVVTQRMMVTK